MSRRISKLLEINGINIIKTNCHFFGRGTPASSFSIRKFRNSIVGCDYNC